MLCTDELKQQKLCVHSRFGKMNELSVKDVLHMHACTHTEYK